METQKNVRSSTPVKAAIIAAAVSSSSAFAEGATGPDFSGILSGVSVTAIVTAVVAAGGLLALANFSKWGAKKIASFFS